MQSALFAAAASARVAYEMNHTMNIERFTNNVASPRARRAAPFTAR
jgi:hypothetical protein